MPPPDPAERRRQRDAALRTMDETIAEHLAEAARSGELRSAESWGKPMAEMEGYQETPEAFRMPFKILKNAGIAPPEVAMFHRRAQLREQLERCTDPAERQRLQQQLSETEQAIALRLEGLRSSGQL